MALLSEKLHSHFGEVVVGEVRKGDGMVPLSAAISFYFFFFFLWCAGNLAGADANFGRGWKILGARTSVNVVSRGSKRHKFLVSESLGKKREHYSLLRASFWRENFPKVWEEVG